MAFGNSAFSVVDPDGFAAFQLNRGLVVPKNEFADSTRLVWTQDATPPTPSSSWVDESDTSSPGFEAEPRLRDELPHRTSKPDTSIVGVSSTWFINIEFSNPITLDSVIVIHKNLASLGVTVTVEIADNALFTTNLVEIANSGVLGSPALGKKDSRVAFYELDHTATAAQIYTTVEFLRIKLTRATVFVPEIHQIVAGSRAQFLVNPLAPFDPFGNVTSTISPQSRGGAARRIGFFRGQGQFTTSFLTATQAEFDPIQDWWDRSEEGTKHFIIAPCPKSDPNDSLLMRIEPPEFFFPVPRGEIQREGAFDLIEQGTPFRKREK